MVRFVRSLASVAMGIHPLKPKDKHCYHVSAVFANALLSNLESYSRNAGEEQENQAIHESSSVGCMGGITSCLRGVRSDRRTHATVEHGEDETTEDDISSQEFRSEQSRKASEKSRLLGESEVERKPSDASEKSREKRKARQQRKYNSFDKRTAGVDGDLEEVGDEENLGQGPSLAARKVSRSKTPDIWDDEQSSPFHAVSILFQTHLRTSPFLF